MLLCIDIGNTSTHYGVVGTDGALFMRHLPTKKIDDPNDGMGPECLKLIAADPTIEGVAFCSVVPDASRRLLDVFAKGLPVPHFQLTSDKKLGVPITYPRPREIGQDRLANAAGAKALVGTPAIVIDMGTAVTFDIVSENSGYEGGIIAPGVEVMRRYLHEQTALLPELDDSVDVPRTIGKSTVEAMRIGTVIGFGGMIQALLDAVLTELKDRGDRSPHILTTGGCAPLLEKTLRTPFRVVPDITLRGLAAAWELNR
jgi:type III pantothenate kinase